VDYTGAVGHPPQHNAPKETTEPHQHHRSLGRNMAHLLQGKEVPS
jgi:hypothetical protein